MFKERTMNKTQLEGYKEALDDLNFLLRKEKCKIDEREIYKLELS